MPACTEAAVAGHRDLARVPFDQVEKTSKHAGHAVSPTPLPGGMPVSEPGITSSSSTTARSLSSFLLSCNNVVFGLPVDHYRLVNDFRGLDISTSAQHLGHLRRWC
jgi:hypothetical protein